MTPSDPPSVPRGPSTLQLLTVAVLGGLLGASGTAWLLRSSPAEPARPSSPSRGASLRSLPAASPSPSIAALKTPPTERNTTPDAAVRGRDDDVPLDPEPPPPAHPPIGAPAEPNTRPLALLPGRVAYLRCPGAPRTAGPYPCPRNLPLEHRTWRALLHAMERCPAARAGLRADVRLFFPSRSAPPEVSLNPRWGDGEQTSLLDCLRTPLAALRMPPPYRRLAISLRFSLLPAQQAPEGALHFHPGR